ncbi:MAG: PEP/pyruvate-binding domain-containing protein, partial [Chloroflexota bacterium]
MITYEGYGRYLANDETVLEQLARELDAILDPAKAYAIRSSASFEDEAQSSSAGQFKTALNIVATQSVIQAIWSIWTTANSDPVNEYLKRVGHPDEML